MYTYIYKFIFITYICTVYLQACVGVYVMTRFSTWLDVAVYWQHV